jgi:GT2 family glycosyltransferase
LRSLKSQRLPAGVDLGLFLMDDGSTDGTYEAVRAFWPEATILHGDGSLFWNQGMRRAWLAASQHNPDYYFLANDDTEFAPEALQCLLQLAGPAEARRIAVALIADPATGQPAYGGVTRDGRRVLPTSGTPQQAETFNGNGVLVPRAVWQDLGVFHDKYHHAMGDYDYGFQARRKGIEIWVSGNVLGTCAPNSEKGTWRDRSLSRRERFRKLNSPKGLPWAEWLEYNRRNYPWTWPWRTISPYLRVALGL